MRSGNIATVLMALFLFGCAGQPRQTERLVVSENHRYIASESGDPFFWIGDTGWLLFSKLNREDAEFYFESRKRKGFNVIQAVLVHDMNNSANFYGDSAIVNDRINRPAVTEGSSPGSREEYDYWDHVDYLISLAGKKGLYMALVPVWGTNIRAGKVTTEQAKEYAGWLASRYGKYRNVIWINGGDVKGSDSLSVWNAIGQTLHSNCEDQPITFHPFGRTQSSVWFHSEPWLSFNMFQSGHRRYDQDTAGLAYGEDNWKYMESDWDRQPVKPSLDGEPSYEGIPQGLHDHSQPRWTDNDVRRYAYWSVFAGGCGITYGHNSVMQFYREGDQPAYGAEIFWKEALEAPGASQLAFLGKLILSRPYFERVPAQELIASNGEKYDRIVATRGNDYAFVYTYTGRNIEISTDAAGWQEFTASWYDPRNGSITETGSFRAGGSILFDPPGEPAPGNDRVLILDKK